MAGAVLTASALVDGQPVPHEPAQRRARPGGWWSHGRGRGRAVRRPSTTCRRTLPGPSTAHPPVDRTHGATAPAPIQLTYPDGGTAPVWIQVVQAFNPPANKVATYKIHAVGRTGNGPGQRVLEQTVTGQPLEHPDRRLRDEHHDERHAADLQGVGVQQELHRRSREDGLRHRAGRLLRHHAGRALDAVDLREQRVVLVDEHQEHPQDRGVQHAPTRTTRTPRVAPCRRPAGRRTGRQASRRPTSTRYGSGLNDDELAYLRSQAQAQGQLLDERCRLDAAERRGPAARRDLLRPAGERPRRHGDHPERAGQLHLER